MATESNLDKAARQRSSLSVAEPARNADVPAAGNAKATTRIGPIDHPLLVSSRNKFSPVSEEYKN
jgi:hypothetical protein